MSRAKWKGPYLDITLSNLKSKLYYTSFDYRFSKKIKKPKRKCIKTQSRSSIITPEFLNTVVLVYNGKQYSRVYITLDKIGHKFGEFSLTRKRGVFKKKTKSKNLK